VRRFFAYPFSAFLGGLENVLYTCFPVSGGVGGLFFCLFVFFGFFRGGGVFVLVKLGKCLGLFGFFILAGDFLRF